MLVSTTVVLGAQLVSLLVSAGAMVRGHYLALRQKFGPPLEPQTYKRGGHLAGKVALSGVVAYLALATAFNLWPGFHPGRTRSVRAVRANDNIEIPASTSELFLYATSAGAICAGTSLVFLRRLIRSMRANIAGFGQIGDILLGCLPFFTLFYAGLAFILWLGRISNLAVGILLESPPIWLMPSLLLWISIVGGIGYLAALRFEKWRYGVTLTLDPPAA